MDRITPERAIEILNYLPKRPDYNTWIKAISAIGNTFPENIAREILLTHFKNEKPKEIEHKLKNRLKGVNIGTLIFIAKQYGYDHKLNTYRPYLKVKPNDGKVKYKTNENPELIYHFEDEGLEERAGIIEFEGNKTRYQAESYIINEYPSAYKERIYRLAINDKVLNKNLNLKTRQPNTNFADLTRGFKNRILTLNEICNCIGKGYAICCSHLKEDSEGRTVRKTDNFLYADLFGIDIDETISIEQALEKEQTRKALLIYTSVSHTEKANRFRIIFPFPRLIRDIEVYRQILTAYISNFQADRNCSDPVRGFYGNDNTTIYNIQTGEILKFKEGQLYEFN